MTKKTGKTKTHFKTNEKIINKQKAAEHAWMQGDGVAHFKIKKKKRQSTRGCKEMEWHILRLKKK